MIQRLHQLLSCLLVFSLNCVHAAPTDVPDLLKLVHGEIQESRETIRKQLALRPEERNVVELTRAYDDLARRQGDIGLYADAMGAIAEAVQQKADDGLLYLTAFKTHLQAGEWDRAQEALKLADARFVEQLQQVGQSAGTDGMDDLHTYLVNRAEWAHNSAHLALARHEGQQAARWAETSCNYSRLNLLVLAVKPEELPVALRRVRRYEEDLRNARSMPAEFEKLSCAYADTYNNLTALITRVKAGLPHNGPVQQQSYGLRGDARDELTDALLPGDKPLHLLVIEQFLLGTVLDEDRILDLVSSQDVDLSSRLDQLCEAYYFVGMYARYVQHDEQRAVRWFTKAVDTWSLGSYELVQARLELGLPPSQPPKTAPAGRAKRRS